MKACPGQEVGGMQTPPQPPTLSAPARVDRHPGCHDLRHTGQTLAAQAGATLADLMKRLGHASMVAAKRYLHAVDGGDAEIAKALSDLAAHGDAARLRKTITMRT